MNKVYKMQVEGESSWLVSFFVEKNELGARKSIIQLSIEADIRKSIN